MSIQQWGQTQYYDDQQQSNDYSEQFNDQQSNQFQSNIIGRSNITQQETPSAQSTVEFRQDEQNDQEYQQTSEQVKLFSCPDHPQQIIKYLIVQKEIPENMSRLACSECIATNKAPFSKTACLLEDLEKDQMVLLKNTNFNLFLQRFCNLYFTNEPQLYPNPENLIKKIIKQFREVFLYRLEEMEKTLIKQAQADYKGNQKNTLEILEELKKKVIPKIDTTKLFEAIEQFKQAETIEIETNIDTEEAVNLDHFKLFSYQLEKLYSTVNEFVQNSIYNEKTQEYLKQFETKLEEIQNQQTEFYNVRHLRATTNKILYQLDQLKFVFEKKILLKSEQSDNFLNKIITQEQADRSQLIYRSSRDGLDYRKIQSLSKGFLNKNALFIFETFTAQTFGVYVDPKMPKNSLLFHMTKRHKYQFTNTEPILQFNQEAQSADPLFQFGGQDLVIIANMNNCTSNLGKGFDISLQKQFIGNQKKGYLGNAENFSIRNMEILVFE